MKTKTTITELTQEDLVDLLCTATYGSMWLSCYAPDRERNGVDITEDDCMEDVWAKVLLAGKKIELTDYNADEGEFYGTLEHYTDEDGLTTYRVSLQDIINGLQKCADGTFIQTNYDESDNGDTEKSWIAKCFQHFKEDTGEMDNPEAESLMQIILFGELIYG
jgi:hypothetical protein